MNMTDSIDIKHRDRGAITEEMLKAGTAKYLELKSGDDYWLSKNTENEETEGVRQIYLAMEEARDLTNSRNSKEYHQASR